MWRSTCYWTVDLHIIKYLQQHALADRVLIWLPDHAPPVFKQEALEGHGADLCLNAWHAVRITVELAVRVHPLEVQQQVLQVADGMLYRIWVCAVRWLVYALEGSQLSEGHEVGEHCTRMLCGCALHRKCGVWRAGWLAATSCISGAAPADCVCVCFLLVHDKVFCSTPTSNNWNFF